MVSFIFPQRYKLKNTTPRLLKTFKSVGNGIFLGSSSYNVLVCAQCHKIIISIISHLFCYEEPRITLRALFRSNFDHAFGRTVFHFLHCPLEPNRVWFLFITGVIFRFPVILAFKIQQQKDRCYLVSREEFSLHYNTGGTSCVESKLKAQWKWNE